MSSAFKITATRSAARRKLGFNYGEDVRAGTNRRARATRREGNVIRHYHETSGLVRSAAIKTHALEYTLFYERSLA